MNDAREHFDLVIVGAGSAGLTGSSFAAKLGARVALAEKARVGGDCTWTGCVPSKALIKAARLVHDARQAHKFGIEVSGAPCDMVRVRAFIRAAVEEVYSRETPQVQLEHGVEVVAGAAEFLDSKTLRVGTTVLSADRVVVATGARPRVPAIDGLSEAPFLTHETIFDNDRLPAHLVVIGGGPIGLELAQAYRRLGAEVTIVAETWLPRESAAVREVIEGVLHGEGVRSLRGRADAVRSGADRVTVHTSAGEVTGDTLLVATGRRPNVEGLELKRAGVEYGPEGIHVDSCLRTTAHGVYAAGDVIGGPQFTHLAGWQCFQAVRNALLPGNAAGQPAHWPRVTFTDPEVAQVGVGGADPLGSIAHRRALDRTDRAVCDGETEGFIEIVVNRSGRILGATIVAPRAGEMITELTLAMNAGSKLADLAATVHPYPTYSMLVQELASEVTVDAFVGGSTAKLAAKLSRMWR